MDRDDLLRSLGTRVSDERVLAAMAVVPRELFVDSQLAGAAYADCPLPIGGGQTISQPAVVAGMCQALDLREDERVLDVGTGSGYHAAVMSRLCRHVFGISSTRCSPQVRSARSRQRASTTSPWSRATARSAYRRKRRLTRSTSQRQLATTCRRRSRRSSRRAGA